EFDLWMLGRNIVDRVIEEQDVDTPLGEFEIPGDFCSNAKAEREAQAGDVVDHHVSAVALSSHPDELFAIYVQRAKIHPLLEHPVLRQFRMLGFAAAPLQLRLGIAQLREIGAHLEVLPFESANRGTQLCELTLNIAGSKRAFTQCLLDRVELPAQAVLIGTDL